MGVAGDLDGPDLQGLCVDPEMDLAPLALVLGTMLFALPLAFAQELDARAVRQQVQRRWVGSRLDLQGLLALADRVEVRHWGVQTGQMQQALHHAQGLSQRLAEQTFDAQAKLDGCVREGRAAATLTAGLIQPLHVPVLPHRQRASRLQRCVVGPFQFPYPHILRFCHAFSL